MIDLQKSGWLTPDVAFAFLVGAILFILLFPLSPVILSVMLVINVSLSLLLLILIFYLKKSLEISSFPTILLVLTLFRLSLNVASTKLILLDGNAGSVIDAFGKFVVRGSYIVGGIVFIILVIINFMVIVKGSSRIAEVSARFTLDAMPGKQMSIDSDLNSGLIDEKEARRRRQELSDEAEFYGAMDGASKFVTGDAIAGIIITVINILGGFAIGVLQNGLPLVDALQKYTVLTIGDGLVSQIPALFISVSAGMLVAKTNSNGGGTGSHLYNQLFSKHEPLYICSIMLMVFAILPGFPFVPFAVVSAICAFMARRIQKKKRAEAGGTPVPAFAGGVPGGALPPGAAAPPQGLPGGSPALPGTEVEKGALPGYNPTEADQMPKVNPMTVELGFSLVQLVDPGQDGDLVARVSMVRKQIKEELGFLIPPISIQDNIELPNNEYRILVRGLERARGTVYPKSFMAINPGDAADKIDGVESVDPTFGFPAVWIPDNKVESAENLGYTVVDASSVVTTHVTKTVKDYAAELLSRQDVSDMLERVRKTNEAVVNELVPGLLSVGVVHRVIQHLLDEQVPIHDLPRILEVLSDYAVQTKDPAVLSEFARQALKGHIVAQHIGSDRTLYAMTLDPRLEEEIQSSVQQGQGIGVMSLPPERAVQIVDWIKKAYDRASSQVDSDVVLLVSPLIRMHVYRMTERKIDGMAVLSYSEISDDIPLQVIASVRAQ